MLGYCNKLFIVMVSGFDSHIPHTKNQKVMKAKKAMRGAILFVMLVSAFILAMCEIENETLFVVSKILAALLFISSVKLNDLWDEPSN